MGSRKSIGIWLALILAVGSITTFVYNGGYGYDAIELLVPARHIAEGHSLYALTTAKPFGAYLARIGIVALLGAPFNRTAITALVVLQILVVAWCGWNYVVRFADRPTAYVAAVLITLAALFMELNYLVVDGVDCYCVAPIKLGAFALASQRAYLCAATHDFRDPEFPLVPKPIEIGVSAWVAAEAFIGPGVIIGERAVVGARAVVVKDVAPGVVVAGIPAREIGRR